MVKKVDELKAKNKLKRKLYYNKNKNTLETLKQETINLKQELTELKIKLSIYNDVYNNKEPDDDDTVNTDDTDDTEPEDNINYNELYNEITKMTKNNNPIYIKDFERNLNPKLLKYQYLFIDNLNDETLDNKRVEWLKNIKTFLDGDNDIEYEEVFYGYQYI